MWVDEMEEIKRPQKQELGVWKRVFCEVRLDGKRKTGKMKKEIEGISMRAAKGEVNVNWKSSCPRSINRLPIHMNTIIKQLSYFSLLR